MAAASSEIIHCKEFDYIVINDRFEAALADLVAIISNKRLECAHQMQKYAALIDDLIKT
jgi:guanylate kinase